MVALIASKLNAKVMVRAVNYNSSNIAKEHDEASFHAMLASTGGTRL